MKEKQKIHLMYKINQNRILTTINYQPATLNVKH